MRRQTFILISILLHLILFFILINLDHNIYILEIIQEDPPLSIKLFPPSQKKAILIAPKIPIIVREFSIGSPKKDNSKILSKDLPNHLTDQDQTPPVGQVNDQSERGSPGNTKPAIKKTQEEPDNQSPKIRLNSKPDFNLMDLYSLNRNSNKTRTTPSDSNKSPNPDSPTMKDFYTVPFDSPDSEFFRSGGSRGFGSGDGKIATGGGAIFNSFGYDITPWAKRVVYRIKKNWIIPATADIGIKGQVNIYTIIKKGGELELLTIKQSSQIHEYDKAAFFAIKTSAPFPTLPANFPYREIEGLIVFHYN